jgi:hypothetical protein
VQRGLHGTATLLPDGTALFAGENREALIRTDDPSFPMEASDGTLYPRGDPDLGVPNGQIVSPPYLFDAKGEAKRPAIAQAPLDIAYKGSFDIKVAGRSNEISSVSILRSDHNTHSFTAGDRYVKLAFENVGSPQRGEIRVYTPRTPAQAVPGIYMLFVVNKDGVPSVAKRVDLGVD